MWLTSEDVYTGVWLNWSRGSLWGGTWKLHPVHTGWLSLVAGFVLLWLGHSLSSALSRMESSRLLRDLKYKRIVPSFGLNENSTHSISLGRAKSRS